MLTELVPKELEILKEALPHIMRLGALFTSTAPSYRPTVQALESAGKTLGIQVVIVPARAAEDFEEAFLNNVARAGRWFSRRGDAAYAFAP